MKKNIAILIPKLTNGGAERVASNLSLYLSEDKYNKHVIVYDADKRDYPFEGELISLDSKSIVNPFGKIINFIKRVYKLKKIKKEHNIHTTISLLSGPNLVNIFAKRNDKVIVSVRNFVSKSSSGFYGRIFNLSIKLLYSKADIIVAVSNTIRNDLVTNFGLNEKKIKVIYNPYDIQKIRELAQEKIEEEYRDIFNNPTIITAGRLTKQKGHWHLLRAFKKINEEIPSTNLVILGQGELEDYLKKLAIEMKIDKDVYFVGFKNNPFKYISRSTVFVLTSLFEGFPNALCEAMATNIPVISADCKSGPREILAPNKDITIESKGIEYEEYGILLPTCDGKMYKFDDELTNQEECLYKSIVTTILNKDILNNYKIHSSKRVKDLSMKTIMKIWENII
ncbi:MAG: glycosyltransferase [Halanaerobiales bacterium]